MIELQIKGPRKKQIENILRQNTQEQKEKLQLLRIKYGVLKEYETKKFTEISLPKIQKARRKNDLAKVISLSVLNKIQQSMSLTDQEAIHLAKLSPQKRSNRLLIKTHNKQPKQDFSDREIFTESQQRKNTKQDSLAIKSRIAKIFELGQEKRRYSLTRKKSIKSIKKITRAITVNSIQRPILDVCSDSLSRKYKLKMKALQMQTDRQLIKQERTMFMKLIDKRLSPSICVIKKIRSKTEPPESENSNQRTEILKKIRFRNDSKRELPKSENSKYKTIQDAHINIPPFQTSLGPWGTTQMGFNC